MPPIQLREAEKLHGVKLVGVSLANAKKKIEQLDGADRIEKLLAVYHRKYTKAELKAECIRMLERVGIDQPQLRYDQYPFEISGGQRQRVETARALIVDPCCLIADEPVSDLDASVQADVINLFDQIRRDREISIVFITRDISIVQYLADRVGVLYKGGLWSWQTRTKSSGIRCMITQSACLPLHRALTFGKDCRCFRRWPLTKQHSMNSQRSATVALY